MTRRIRKHIALICVVSLLVAMLVGFTAGVATENISYIKIPMFVNGDFVGYGLKIGDTTSVPIRAFSEAVGQMADVSWSEETNTVDVRTDGLEIQATVGNQYITANGRYIYIPDGVYNIDGTVYIPARELARIFGVSVEWDPEIWTVSIIGSEEVSVIEGADEFYDETDLYWLSRLINAESGNQELDGMVAVGNVVMNRVSDPTYPETVYGVIFDYRYGVQFHVTVTGGIYAEPNEESIIAAKICLEGYQVVGDSLYFVNPEVGISSWFNTHRTYVATIGDHVFYA